MKHFPLIVLCGGLLISCGVSRNPAYVTVDECSLEKQRVGALYLYEVYTKYGYRSYSSMTSLAPKIQGFGYDFYTYEDLSEKAAEQRVSSLIELLKEVVRRDERVRPHLAEWPFEHRETSITIALMDPSTGRFRRAPKIAVVGNKAGQMYKTYAHPETGWLMNEKKYKEYLEQKGDMPLASQSDEKPFSKESKPLFNSEPTHEEAVSQSIDNFLR